MQNHTLQTLHDYYNYNNPIYFKQREPSTPQFQKKYFMRLEEKKQFRIKRSKADLLDKILLQQQQLTTSFKPWSIPRNLENNETNQRKDQSDIRFVSINNLRIKCLINNSTQSQTYKEINQNKYSLDKRFRTSPGLKKIVNNQSQVKTYSLNHIVNRNLQQSLYSSLAFKQSLDDISPW
ncbi:unnamed protein product (macronuclear) [Paramecium tetraurelia]|uniref:Uncharacterized protein n=1 Tax=Paramecium tetraurelia TaxID=5888 RepID=A0DGA4_PARTE|nr:uncharacterized protein GSPATT00002200001 [Paramecium tetraurelia]CAK82071.1 unnamed protein product [Paramecium tetraurelia]|eukprot:XP_001449468.1 hypothetical protein (macronuclear) [Paramecium tetraurelia strain d4-2]